MTNFFWARFNSDGRMIEQKQDGEGRVSDAQRRDEGFEPISIPKGVAYGSWTGFTWEEGFEWPSYRKDWRAFRLALLSHLEYRDVDAAAMESIALAHRIHAFNDTLRELIDGGATPQELQRFQIQWGALEAIILTKQFTNYTGIQVAAKIREIADTLSIILDHGRTDTDGLVPERDPDGDDNNHPQVGPPPNP